MSLGHIVNKLTDSLVKMTHEMTHSQLIHIILNHTCTLIKKSCLSQRKFKCGFIYFPSFINHTHNNVFGDYSRKIT